MFNFRTLVPALLVSLSLSIAGSPARAATAPLKGIIADLGIWNDYKTRFVRKNGRVVDNANKNISHSEGQGFAMVMAVAANDPILFDQIWSFTRQHMMVRKDNLIAWRWSPRGFSRVTDKNNATDGDILVAWALLEAAESGFGAQYRHHAKKIIRDLAPLAKKDPTLGWWLRPGAKGFSSFEHKGREIINLSYWVFPALERIGELTGGKLWPALENSGERMLARAADNKAGLPADWNAFKRGSGKVGLARKFGTKFSYNAIRVPLYLAWSGEDRSAFLAPMQANWVNRGRSLSQIDVRRNTVKGRFADRGYHAVAAVVNCSLSGTRFPEPLRGNLDKLYYPASLHILSIIATKQRYPQCW